MIDLISKYDAVIGSIAALIVLLLLVGLVIIHTRRGSSLRLWAKEAAEELMVRGKRKNYRDFFVFLALALVAGWREMYFTASMLGIMMLYFMLLENYIYRIGREYWPQYYR